MVNIEERTVGQTRELLIWYVHFSHICADDHTHQIYGKRFTNTDKTFVDRQTDGRTDEKHNYMFNCDFLANQAKSIFFTTVRLTIQICCIAIICKLLSRLTGNLV